VAEVLDQVLLVMAQGQVDPLPIMALQDRPVAEAPARTDLPAHQVGQVQ